jgi:hypothetical protein
MKAPAVHSLSVAGRAPIVAVGLVTRGIEIWNWETGEKVSEFDSVFRNGGRRLAIDPAGEFCVAASWKKGKSDGVACYRTHSGETVWHRTDMRRVQGLRISTAGDAVACWIEGASVEVLNTSTGESAGTMHGVRSGVAVHHGSERARELCGFHRGEREMAISL